MIEVLSVASEAFPLVKTGGLADVVGALPKALAAEGVRVRTLLPGYPMVSAGLAGGKVVARLDALFGGEACVLAGHAGGLDVLIVDAPHLYRRDGGPYADQAGRDWPDNAQRFAALAQVAAELAGGLAAGYAPAIVHGHDWQAGLMPAYLRYRGKAQPGTVMTVHNLAFQGQFPAGLLASLGLPPQAYATDGVEYYGSIGFLKAGLLFADRVTTVSPSYAEEIRGPGGMGMEGLLRGRGAAFHGILNGLDCEVWNPARDDAITAPFDAAGLARRTINKAALQRRLGLAVVPERPLFGVISRLTWQKGIDLLLEAMPALLAGGAQLAMLGSGEAGLESGFADLAADAPGRVGVVLGYDEALAHQIQAGSDVLVVPSRFEPCGLTQLAALRYGALPLVSHVGGLADTVIDANDAALAAGVATGWQVSPVSAAALTAAVGRVLACWRDRDTWQTMQRRAMGSDVGWSRPAKQYAALYREVLAR